MAWDSSTSDTSTSDQVRRRHRATVVFGLTHDSFGPNPNANAQWTNSPLLSWVYGLTSVQGFSAVLGVIEVGIALLIAARPFAARAAALGSLLAVGMFLTT